MVMDYWTEMKIPELKALREEMESEGLRFPGKFDKSTFFRVSGEDWKFLNNL